MPNSDLKIAAAWAGVGTRAWPALAARAGPGDAILLPQRAVRDRLVLRLDASAADRGRAHATLARMDDLLAQGLSVAGYLGYEFGLALAGRPLPCSSIGAHPPDVDLLVFDARDLQTAPLPALAPAAAHAELAATPADLHRQKGAWLAAVAQALDAIRAGSLYQVNLSVAFDVPAPAGLDRAPLLPILAAALQTQPVPYALAFEGVASRLLSGSMERLVAVDGLHVSSRPIKGTAPRGTGAADELARLGLLASAKERAENTMIVDMVRNDLSRVCAPGSVAVPHLLDCEPYTTLWHLESEVHGRMVGGARHGDLLSAILPPASVTGCPKVAAMGFIAGAEARRRGPYCGAMGLALAGGRADWSVGIRQLNVVDGRVQLSVGSGIVADSVAEREWAETCLKAAGGLLWLRRLVGLLAPRLSGQPRVAWRP